MKIIVADDSALLREGIAGLLERQGHTVLARASDANELVAGVAAHAAQVDVVITDVRMPPTLTDDGLRAALRIRAAYPAIALLLVSQYVAPEYARELFDTDAGGLPEGGGGLGYLLKDRVAEVADFLRSLAVVAAGTLTAWAAGRRASPTSTSPGSPKCWSWLGRRSPWAARRERAPFLRRCPAPNSTRGVARTSRSSTT